MGVGLGLRFSSIGNVVWKSRIHDLGLENCIRTKIAILFFISNSLNVSVPRPKRDSGSGVCKSQITHISWPTEPPVNCYHAHFLQYHTAVAVVQWYQSKYCSESIKMSY